MSSNDPREENDWPIKVKKFVCHQCGNCCRGDGFVALTRDDIVRMSKLLGLSREDFLGRYAQFDRESRTWILLDQKDELKSCIFLTPDVRCQVHEAKPEQCVGFPTRWRSPNIAEYCDGWRAMEGLPPSKKKTI